MKFDTLYKQIIGEDVAEVRKNVDNLRNKKAFHADRVDKAAQKGNINKTTGDVEDPEVDASTEVLKKATQQTAKAIKNASLKK